ncbi:hypothetical protein ACGE24_07985 [Corynebacterium kroppenstedtii]|uniref:hypothetical protein n=1 Tax=Corynebacterium sp. PCR 32 TaxID=3351342 RepID=UPI0030A71E5E
MPSAGPSREHGKYTAAVGKRPQPPDGNPSHGETWILFPCIDPVLILDIDDTQRDVDTHG